MSDIQGIMKFEHLPNELLFVFFEYLNIFEIFNLFDPLNFRFSKLIRNLRYQLNFANVRKTLFDQFCTKIKFNPEIKQQIYSLKLSNQNTCGQIEIFLSNFSLNEFSHLRSLTLVEIEERNIEKFKSILPLLSKLSTFCMFRQKCEDNQILDVLPMSNLQTLSILSLTSLQTRLGDTSNITKLTIHTCSLEHLLYHLFKYFPMLTYFNVQYVSRYNHPMKNDPMMNKYNGIYLKQLIIGLFKYNFDDLELFLKQIPNLKSLIIQTKDDISMMNAFKWKNLIQFSLSSLKIFEFKFGCDRRYKDEIISKKFQHFQEKFWCKQHQWFTEYSFEKHLAFIYTIPYLSYIYELKSDNKRFPNQSINNSNAFSKVTNVRLSNDIIIGKDQYYFSNIESLALSTSEEDQYYFSNIESLALSTSAEDQKSIDIDYLKMIVNLSNLKRLNISMYKKMLLPKEILEILKESPKLTSISIKSSNLISLFDDDELCQYLNKMIQTLYIHRDLKPSFKNFVELKKFCEIFSKIEQLTCYVMKPDDVLFLLDQLLNLSTLNVWLPPLEDNRDYFSSLFVEDLRRFNGSFRVQGIDVKAPELSMWIGRNMHVF